VLIISNIFLRETTRKKWEARRVISRQIYFVLISWALLLFCFMSLRAPSLWGENICEFVISLTFDSVFYVLYLSAKALWSFESLMSRSTWVILSGKWKEYCGGEETREEWKIVWSLTHLKIEFMYIRSQARCLSFCLRLHILEELRFL
jgi:hypothetical protein